jgi:hypothetical protein
MMASDYRVVSVVDEDNHLQGLIDLGMIQEALMERRGGGQ